MYNGKLFLYGQKVRDFRLKDYIGESELFRIQYIYWLFKTLKEINNLRKTKTVEDFFKEMKRLVDDELYIPWCRRYCGQICLDIVKMLSEGELENCLNRLTWYFGIEETNHIEELPWTTVMTSPSLICPHCGKSFKFEVRLYGEVDHG